MHSIDNNIRQITSTPQNTACTLAEQWLSWQSSCDECRSLRSSQSPIFAMLPHGLLTSQSSIMAVTPCEDQVPCEEPSRFSYTPFPRNGSVFLCFSLWERRGRWRFRQMERKTDFCQGKGKKIDLFEACSLYFPYMCPYISAFPLL